MSLIGNGLTKYMQNNEDEYETHSLVAKTGIKIQHETEGQGQSSPKSISSAKMHFWSKFGNPDFNWCSLIVQTSSK